MKKLQKKCKITHKILLGATLALIVGLLLALIGFYGLGKDLSRLNAHLKEVSGGHILFETETKDISSESVQGIEELSRTAIYDNIDRESGDIRLAIAKN